MAVSRNSSSLELCVLELLLNSLKSKSSAIAVRIDIGKRKIQVIDNGHGIAKKELKHVGEGSNRSGENSTNKGNRYSLGPNLIDIRKLSMKLTIMSKVQFSSDTYGKFFDRGHVPVMKKIENRPTWGTTVIFYPSNSLLEKKHHVDFYAIRFMIVYLALVNQQVSFSVRDDAGQCIILRVGKDQKYRRLLQVMWEEKPTKNQVFHVKTFNLDDTKMEIFWGVEIPRTRKIRQIFVNLRPVNCGLLKKFVKKIAKNLIEEQSDKKGIFFLLYIGCPEEQYNFCTKGQRWEIEFCQIQRIMNSIKKMMKKNYFEKSKPRKTSNYKVIVPFINNPTGNGVFGLKQKKSFFKITKKRMERARKMELKNPQISSKTEKPEKIRDTIDSNRTKKSTNNSSTMEQEKPKFCATKHSPTFHESEINVKSCENLEHEPENFSQKKENKNCYKDRQSLNEIEEIAERSEIFLESVENSNISNQNSSTMNQEKNDSQLLLSGKNCDKWERNFDDILARKENIESRRESTSVQISKNHDAALVSQKVMETSQRTWENDENNVLEKWQEDLNETLATRKYFESRSPSIQIFENHDVAWISQKIMEKSEKDMENSENNVDASVCAEEEIYDMIELSQWSNWSYHSQKYNENEAKECAQQSILYRRFKFLPRDLHALLPRANVKLINRELLNHNDDSPMQIHFNNRRKDLDVRPCTVRSVEFSLKLQSLKHMKVLNQVNREFIVALTEQDGKELLVIIDQHAMHERIRYEDLLRAYKTDTKHQEFISVGLHRPMTITDFSANDCNLLWQNRNFLKKYGLNFCTRDDNTLIVVAVPRCFFKKSLYSDKTVLEIAVKKLLQEFLNDLGNDGIKKILPFAVHDAIASEACRGAIKFGDPLTIKQCELLVSCWKDTDAPNRCAHGRPSVVPLLELAPQNKNPCQRNVKVSKKSDSANPI